MAKILLNGEPREVDEGLTVTRLLDASAYAGRRVAVEINREIVPKSQHAQRIVHDGDHVQIVQAMGGG
jgi:sulfur carrier protein